MLDARIAAQIERLIAFPDSGRPGRVDGTRELVVAPYVVAYAANMSHFELTTLNGALATMLQFTDCGFDRRKIMRAILKSTCIAAAMALMTVAPAFAQGGGGGGGGGGQGGPPATSPGVNQPDRDQLRDQDQDRDRLRDQDRLYLGAQDRFRQHDQDGDGRLSQGEFRQWHERAFNAIDGDNSGAFTLQEFQYARFGPGPQGSARNRQRIEERAQVRKTGRFRLMDGNGDGVVSRNEYMNFGELNYLDADANDDGRLTFRELQKFHRGW